MRTKKVIYINEHNGSQAITYRSGVQLVVIIIYSIHIAQVKVNAL